MSSRPLRLVIPLVALFSLVLLVAGCANPEEQEALGTPDPDVTMGVLPETGGEVTSAPEPSRATTVVTESAEVTSSMPVIGGEVSGTAPSASQTVTGASGTGPGATQVQVVVNEYNLEMVDTVPAGRVIFEVTNDGNWEHGFVLTGNGITATLEKPLAPDELGRVEVELAPGIYTVYCPVDGHAGLGMNLDLTVTEP